MMHGRKVAVLGAAALLAANVGWAQIVLVPQSGTGDAGIGSRPIANTVSKDTVNGSPATLGVSGNATISRSGKWPQGIGLALTTGAVTTSTSLPVGTYAVAYQLCESSAPTVCATATDTVTVVNAAIVALADSGTTISGIASKPIKNVAANDTIHGAPAVLGPGGNGSVSESGSWPTGIALNPSTGAISTTAAIAVGTYNIAYQLCDTNVPAVCATTVDTVIVNPGYAEVEVGSVPMVDIEFDWGRDGIYCAACNYGEGNARFNWTDKLGNLWIGHIDPTTGEFTPPAGNNELADTTAFYSAVFGNGPEWVFSTPPGAPGGNPISQLVYARYPPGLTEVNSNAGAAFTTPVQGGWSPTFLPGAEPVPSGGTITGNNPSGSQCNSDPVALTYFYDTATPPNIYYEAVTTAPGTAPILSPLSNYSNIHISGGKPSIRWVACTHDMVFVGNAPPTPNGVVYQQVFLYDTDTQVVQQLTFDAVNHAEAYMFKAPEFNGAYAIYTIAGGTVMEIYEQNGVSGNGLPKFNLVNRITSPDNGEPYMAGTEPFINCTPTCQSYIFTRLQSEYSYNQPSGQAANGVGVMNISPSHPMFKVLASEGADTTVQRIDLEYYITANGPYLYYDRNTITTSTTTFTWGNRYYIDMQLGAPSGSCVGSSAEGGLLPGC